MLARLDVPYIAAHPVEFQTLEQWGASDRGLLPVESHDHGGDPRTRRRHGPMVFGGRSDGRRPARAANALHVHGQTCAATCTSAASARECWPRASAKLVALRRAERAPIARSPSCCSISRRMPATPAPPPFCRSSSRCINTLRAHAGARAITVELPANVDALRERIARRQCGTVRRRRQCRTRASRPTITCAASAGCAEIEAQWGPAPGKQQSDGSSIFVLGERFGNVFVGVQPAFGYEGDPMRLLFEKGFAPTHAFSAFYRWLREDFGADAVLHFGTHGALEFMPGKQAGMSGACWPDRLIGDLPNFYLYASNNPSEGTIAKRRAGGDA